MQRPVFTKDRSCHEKVQGMELIRVLPKHLQQHVQLTMGEHSSFEVKERILAFELVSSTWTKDRMVAHAGISLLGAVTSNAVADSGGSAPMEIKLIKGKGEWKGKRQSDKGKTKGKQGSDKGKTKGRQFDKGKGKNTGKGFGECCKGSQTGNSGTKLDANVCAYCGKHGHWQRGCLKKKADQQNKQVRVFEDVGSISMVCAVEPEESFQAVRAVQPGIVMRMSAAGWNRLNPQMVAIKATASKHVGTTLVPSEELMWLRTALVCREGSGWETTSFVRQLQTCRKG
eukprot:s1537_g14.t1